MIIHFKLAEACFNRNFKRGVGPSLYGFQPLPATQWGLVGVTKDEDTSAIVPNVTVDVYTADTKQFVGTTVSDGFGLFIFMGLNGWQNYFFRAYLVGSPDQSGTTTNNLVASSFVYQE